MTPPLHMHMQVRIDKAPIKLKALALNHPLLTLSTLSELLSEHYRYALEHGTGQGIGPPDADLELFGCCGVPMLGVKCGAGGLEGAALFTEPALLPLNLSPLQ